jgi:polyisoprenoid-binding protein YceI
LLHGPFVHLAGICPGRDLEDRSQPLSGTIRYSPSGHFYSSGRIQESHWQRANYDPADPSKTSLEATIDATTVDTRVEMRDKDLRSPNFLDVEKYPTITFKSKRAEPAGAGKLKITGDLTIHGVTREVVLDVDGPTAPVKDPRGNLHLGASATTKINRKDFGVNGAPAMAGDEISITIDAELIK